MEKEKKALVKYFVLIFLISVLAINWNDISWIFNYKAISRIISSAFESKTNAGENDILNKTQPLKESEPSEKENTLEIPKLEISVPLIFSESAEVADLYKSLDRGAVYFPGSALPGESGQTIILGHSAPAGWPKIKHDWIFTRISELTEGDKIIVHFNERKYTYSVSDTLFLDRGEELPQTLTNSDNMLALISCWPPGSDIRRIAVMAD